jgi:CO dehydrogenase nickel-insertion accessory protein CooC1
MNNNSVISDEIFNKDATLGITGSPNTTISVAMDIVQSSRQGSLLGRMVYFIVNEDGNRVAVVGQVISIETRNRWHEDPSFKGVIRLHGNLPHLSGDADNRIATISVQSSYRLDEEGSNSFRVSNSPSSGIYVKKMSNEAMTALMQKYNSQLTYIGTVYGTDVDMPLWFRHFGNGDNGAGDAHHIAVFGKSGSGKSVTAAYMLRGFCKNSKEMSVLFLDPQRQFYLDKDLPFKFKDEIESLGMHHESYELLKDMYLPGTEFQLFASMIRKKGLVRNVLKIFSDEKSDYAELAISEILDDHHIETGKTQGNLNNCTTDASKTLFKHVLKKLGEDNSKYAKLIYSNGMYLNRLIEIADSLTKEENNAALQSAFEKYWQPVAEYFMNQDRKKVPLSTIIKKITEEKGNFIVIDISANMERLGDENIQAMFVRLIEEKIKIAGERAYENNEKLNCLIVMDEAHRFISSDSNDPQIKELTREIIDSVRTTRKYGIGYMFITQTIESLDEEILRQTRIFAFGYGLTLGSEIRVIQNLVNNKEAVDLYKTFIDPSSTHSYPFMFYGSVSPLSFTGSPLFVEVYSDPTHFK